MLHISGLSVIGLFEWIVCECWQYWWKYWQKHMQPDLVVGRRVAKGALPLGGQFRLFNCFDIYSVNKMSYCWRRMIRGGRRRKKEWKIKLACPQQSQFRPCLASLFFYIKAVCHYAILQYLLGSQTCEKSIAQELILFN